MRLLQVLFLNLIISILSCSSIQPALNNSPLEEFVSKRLSEASIDYNPTKDIALCYEGKINASGIKRYELIQVSNHKILKEGNFRPGYIKWINNNEIELLDLPGLIKENQDLNQYKKIISVSLN